MDSIFRTRVPAGWALLLAVAFAGCSVAAEYKPAATGTVVPDFTLKDTSGTAHTLSQYKGKVVVLDFCSQECPWSRGVDKDLPAAAKEYAAKGVVFLGIDSHKSTTPEQIKAYAAEKGIPFPILKDAGNAYADAVGATHTPQFYILDKDGKLAYQGAYDDRKEPESPGQTGYVKEALNALLAGQPVARPQANAWGCTIKRAK